MPKALAGSSAGPVRPLTDQEFARISQLAYDRFGLELKPGKEELVSARLGKKVRAAGCRSFQEYYRRVVEDTTGEALIELIDALTTNFTGFMREPAHFEFLRKHILPEWIKRGSIRIWSAACSTGEEPYTIAFSLLDALGSTRLPVQIVATDISSRALGEAQGGTYPAARLELLPAAWQHSFLLRGEGQWKGWYRVKPEVSRLIEFRRLNLIEPFSHAQPFAAIFCRNVMIYFDKQTQQSLIERLAAQLAPGGYLLIGHSESLTGIEHPLTYVRPTVYRKGPK
ncbi:MAG TPA: protein-glutamate O-methyltransferase CheR [Bryobacteraceae bacterium]|nr:protein-glutamate O-methyltransferase CheR [Bryobacteraceae bacterium]